jgi:hypothetical protein
VPGRAGPGRVLKLNLAESHGYKVRFFMHRPRRPLPSPIHSGRIISLAHFHFFYFKFPFFYSLRPDLLDAALYNCHFVKNPLTNFVLLKRGPHFKIPDQTSRPVPSHAGAPSPSRAGAGLARSTSTVSLHPRRPSRPLRSRGGGASRSRGGGASKSRGDLSRRPFPHPAAPSPLRRCPQLPPAMPLLR